MRKFYNYFILFILDLKSYNFALSIRNPIKNVTAKQAEFKSTINDRILK